MQGLACAVLLLTGLGMVWQSGYLKRPLGLTPLWHDHREVGGKRRELRRSVFQAAQDSSGQAAGLAYSGRVAEEGVAAVESVKALTDQAWADRSTPAESRPALPSPEILLSESRGPYTIRLASYPPGSAVARRYLQRLRQGGEEVFFSPVVVEGQPFERLLIGSFSTWDEAHGHARRLQQEGGLEEFSVLRLPYAVELGRFSDCAQANQAARESAVGDNTTYVQLLEDGSCRVLAGAFATAAEVQDFVRTRSAFQGQVVQR